MTVTLEALGAERDRAWELWAGDIGSSHAEARRRHFLEVDQLWRQRAGIDDSATRTPRQVAAEAIARREAAVVDAGNLIAALTFAKQLVGLEEEPTIDGLVAQARGVIDAAQHSLPRLRARLAAINSNDDVRPNMKGAADG